MAWVTQTFKNKWVAGQMIGPDTPQARVQVQAGRWGRGYQNWPGPPMRANIFAEPHAPLGSLGSGGFWRATWLPSSAWVTVPNIVQIKLSKDFSQKGITVAEITLDALDYANATGALGDAYHVIAPGFLAPYRGYVPTHRPDPQWGATAFEGVLIDGVKIRVWAGLGPPVPDLDASDPPTTGGDNGTWVYAGQIDDVDTDAGESMQGSANSIVIVARNGKLLTDQHLFGWTKSQQLPDPITFYDELTADVKTLVGFQARAIDHETNYPSANVLDRPVNVWDHTTPDPAYLTTWRGPAGASSSDVQWLQVRLPAGRYDDCWLYIPGGSPVAWVGLYANPIVTHTTTGPVVTAPRMDGVDLTPGWIPGPGVPGVGGPDAFPYFRYVSVLNAGGNPINIVQFGHTLEIGDKSILRLAFTNLPTLDGAPRMEVADLHGRRRRFTANAASGKWITVPDASDVVRVVLRWCGYTNWDVEESGVRLNGRLIFNRTQTPMDIIDTIAQQLGFIFFIADPVDGDSDGIPTFRRDSSLLVDNNYIAADLRDDGNLTGVKRKTSDENRVFVIRVRGTSAPASRDIPGSHVSLPYGGGFTGLGGDTIKRLMAVYFPPWAHTDAHAGVLRRIIFHDNNLNNYAQCVMACYLIALNAALAMHTLQVSIPAHPIIELDDQVTVLDEASGTNSRMWVTKMETTMHLGDQQTSGSGGAVLWTSTLEGALIDTPEFDGVITQLLGVDWVALANQTGTGQPPLPGPIVKGKSRPTRQRGWPPV